MILKTIYKLNFGNNLVKLHNVYINFCSKFFEMFEMFVLLSKSQN